MKMKIHKGDTVEVISGRLEDKGKRGEVIRVLTKENRVVVQGVNLRTKHQRQVQRQGRNISPGKIRFEAPIDLSNVLLVCPKCSKTTRVGISRGDDGKALRVCKQCDAAIDE
ncbi:MAG: 50S ribosomal protein L24 [Bellilinea sp.]